MQNPKKNAGKTTAPASNLDGGLSASSRLNISRSKVSVPRFSTPRRDTDGKMAFDDAKK